MMRAVRQRVALARGTGTEQELAHGGREAHPEGGDIVGDELHGVVDRHPGVHRATGTVDVEEDVALVVFCVEQQHLRTDRVRVRVLDLGAEEDDALLEQPLVDVVVEARGAVAARCLDGRGVVVSHVSDTSGHHRQTHAT